MADPRLTGHTWRTRTRPYVLARDGYTCVYCGARATQVDHVIPRSKGGGDQPGNLVAACRACNASRGNRTGPPPRIRKPAYAQQCMAMHGVIDNDVTMSDGGGVARRF